MWLPVRFAILLFLSCYCVHIHAANEWKNPDLESPKTKPVAPPVSGPAAGVKAVPLPVPAPASQDHMDAGGRVIPGEITGAALDVIRICDYELSYIDRGSGGKIDAAFYLPNIPAGYFMLGSYAQGNYHYPSDCVLAVKPANQKSRFLLQAPLDWERRWTDKGSGANMDGSIWHPRPQGNEYVCLGSVARKGYQSPALTNYACVHRCLVERLPPASPVWSTKGTGAKYKAYIYKLHNSNSFYVRDNKSPPSGLQDIKGDTRCMF